ncbi:MAG: hypothetical protein ACTSWP_06660 [Candidatus Freyarchaeota archaeon]|nr:hypothetical protein [Candidatus Freyrarchaeum guaymaensis]
MTRVYPGGRRRREVAEPAVFHLKFAFNPERGPFHVWASTRVTGLLWDPGDVDYGFRYFPSSFSMSFLSAV